MTGKDDVCLKLDKKLIEFFDTLSQLYLEQDKLDITLKSGHLNLSRARYSMGIRNVGIEQCDENKMKASVKVSISDDQLFDMDNNLDLESGMKDIDLNSEDNQSKVRRRKGEMVTNDKSSETKDSVEDIPIEKLEKKKSSSYFDPLKWFGVLVPPALRQSQSDFKSSVNNILSIATLKTKLVSLQKEYQSLLAKKAEFETS
ncbi:hypothetical protein ACF0H5_019106 [Mactra antiquata]